MSNVVAFPPEKVRRALRILTSIHANPDEEVEAALVLLDQGVHGTLTTTRAVTLALSALYRNRTHYRALALAEALAKLEHPDVRAFGLGLVKELGSLVDLEVGCLLLGG